jgi:hypothetical protein
VLECRRRSETGGVVEILDGDRNPVQRTDPSALLNVPLGRLRAVERRLCGNGDEGIESRLKPLDSLETRVHQLHRRDLAPTDQLTGLVQGGR